MRMYVVAIVGFLFASGCGGPAEGDVTACEQARRAAENVQQYEINGVLDETSLRIQRGWVENSLRFAEDEELRVSLETWSKGKDYPDWTLSSLLTLEICETDLEIEPSE